MAEPTDGRLIAYGSLAAEVQELIDAGAFPETALGEYAAVAQVVQRRIAEMVESHRTHEPRKSWAAIGAELGVTAQAAQQRFGGNRA